MLDLALRCFFDALQLPFWLRSGPAIHAGDQQQVWKQDESSEQLHQRGEQITIERNLPLSSLAPGRYTLEVYVIDFLTKQTVSRSAPFVVKPAVAAKPMA